MNMPSAVPKVILFQSFPAIPCPTSRLWTRCQGATPVPLNLPQQTGEILPLLAKALKGGIPVLECHLPEAVLQTSNQLDVVT
jgi:hypothetical protein